MKQGVVWRSYSIIDVMDRGMEIHDMVMQIESNACDSIASWARTGFAS